jgi:hypothetical protein
VSKGRTSMISRGPAVRFSRSGFTSPYGKLDGWLERQRIESSIKDKFTQRAASVGKPRAEALRDLARVIALGPDEAARMYGEGVLKVVRLIVDKSDA